VFEQEIVWVDYTGEWCYTSRVRTTDKYGPSVYAEIERVMDWFDEPVFYTLP
jgi:hypothetical protein